MNRRRHLRVPWQHHNLEGLTLEVEERGKGAGWREVACTLVDLAAGGVGVLVGEPLNPGSRVRVTFPLPPALDEEFELDQAEPWSALAEVVHARHMPEPAHQHVPAEAHLPHHRGARFQTLESESEVRLLRALYGPLPAGWGVEQYRVRRPGAAAAPRRSSARGAGKGSAVLQDETVPRFAVVRDGKRVAWGFSTYERARGRAMSIHMDEVAEARRARARAAKESAAAAGPDTVAASGSSAAQQGGSLKERRR